MSVRLVVTQRSEVEGQESATRALTLDEPIINLGRDKSCQVPLQLQAVSRNHARISRDGALFFIEDLGSAYGTQINGQALNKGEKHLLRDGDVIGIAQFDVEFARLPDIPKEQQADKTGIMARNMVKSAMRGLGGADGPYFRMMNGPEEGRHIQLSDARELVFGRDDDVDVVLQDDLVSRRHAKVRRDWAGTHVEDLASRNGVRVNRKRITRKTLADRDEVEIGGAKLLYVDPSEVDSRPVRDEVEDDGREHTPPTRGPPPPRPAPEPEPIAQEEDAPSDSSESVQPAQEEPAEEAAMEAEGSASEAGSEADSEGGSEAASEDEQPFESEEQPSEEEQNGYEEQAPVQMTMQLKQWIIVGLGGATALLVLGLVLYILLGA